MSYIKINHRKFFYPSFILIAWTLYGLFFASQSYLRQLYSGRGADWQNALAIWLTCAYSWAILTPAIIAVARRFPFSRDNWLVALAVQLPASVLFSVAALTVFAGFRMLFGDSYSLGQFQNLVIGEIHSCVLVYFAMMGVYYAANYWLKPVGAEPAANAQNENGNLQASLKNGDHGVRPLTEIIDPQEQRSEHTAYAARFTIKQNGRIIFVSVADIDLITSDGNYVKLHTNGRSLLLRETMKAMEQKLDPSIFVRVRRSAIVRVDQIKELHPLFNGEFEIVLKNGIRISSSRRYRRNLDSVLRS